MGNSVLRVEVKPELLRWARERSGLDAEELSQRVPRFGEWESGASLPTLRQLECFAKATRTPVGFLFLSAPPEESVPIPDFRTMENRQMGRPSPDLLETIYICQQRQEWYRAFCSSIGAEARTFVGTAKVTSSVESTAAEMRRVLRFDLEERRRMVSWTDALRRFIELADDLGVLVMVSGVVGSNTTRKLDPEEFRGFALVDSLAPLVFLNGADTKAGQMFSLAHELAHVWLGETALSNDRPVSTPRNRAEAWCNRVAAEFLVPLASLKKEYDPKADLWKEVARLKGVFKVSSLVILRRIHDAGGLTESALWKAYKSELARLLATPKSSGGDFYLTQAARVGKRFARALVSQTLEGLTLYTEAFRLLGFSKLATFEKLGDSLGVV
ncbi:MAG: hypothetical protein FD180_389 [Planctomycetota bacterium]|nr:MAG: hypothetical protein FD180_389 [Planctomycetota bacterium]